MTKKQEEIKALWGKGFRTIEQLATKLETTERGMKIAISKHPEFEYNEEEEVYKSYTMTNQKEESDLERIERLQAEIEAIKERNKKTLVNLTAHSVIVEKDGKKTTYAPSGNVCRVTLGEEVILEFDGIEVKKTSVIDIVNFDPKDGEVYIVSGLVGEYLHSIGFEDYVMPNTREARKLNGKIMSVKSFWRY